MLLLTLNQQSLSNAAKIIEAIFSLQNNYNKKSIIASIRRYAVFTVAQNITAIKIYVYSI